MLWAEGEDCFKIGELVGDDFCEAEEGGEDASLWSGVDAEIRPASTSSGAEVGETASEDEVAADAAAADGEKLYQASPRHAAMARKKTTPRRKTFPPAYTSEVPSVSISV